MPTGITPIYTISQEGRDITSRFQGRTTSIQIEMTNTSSDVIKIEIDDRETIAEVPVGAWISVQMGYEEVGLAPMGTYRISEVTYQGPPRSIVLTGLSVDMDGELKSRMIKDFENKTVEEVLQTLAQKGGVQALVHPSLAQIKLPFKNQIGVSPMHMIHEMERHFDAIAKFTNGKLVFVPRDGGESATGQQIPTLVLQPHHFGGWSVKYNTRSQFSEVKAAYWDKDQQKTVWLGLSNDLFKLLEGEGAEAASDAIYRLNKKYTSREEAEQAMKSQMATLRRAECEAVFELAKGDPWVRDQMRCVVQGMRPGVDGSYVIEQVVHGYRKETGITTRIEAKSPGSGEDFSQNMLPPEEVPTFNNVSPDDYTQVGQGPRGDG